MGTTASFSNWYFSYLLCSCLPISRPATVAQDPHLKQPGGLILSLVKPSLSPWRLAHPDFLKGLHTFTSAPPALENMPESWCRVRTHYGTIPPQPLLSQLPRGSSWKDLKPNKIPVLSKDSLKACGIRQTLSALGGTESEGLWTEYQFCFHTAAPISENTNYNSGGGGGGY